ncbi:Hypp7059 [Branchiostoma lanceolatum]|uniref:Hypp7059 protein n=1 Tax=Branchiostoma lanceolatum TaxID=7740 RepID=A0A8J9YWP0_BRALA|nr:Hypp7059 [Branchiostoma lanceolatum]
MGPKTWLFLTLLSLLAVTSYQDRPTSRPDVSSLDRANMTFVEYWTRLRVCESNLVQSMCQNPGTTVQQCSSGDIAADFSQCVRSLLFDWNCQGSCDTAAVNVLVEQTMAQSFMFNDSDNCAGYGGDLVQRDPPEFLAGCPADFPAQVTAWCYTPFLNKWQTNPADPTLCRQYAYTKECWHQLTSTLCNYDDPFIDWLDPQWDDFNPFMEHCPCDAAPQTDVSERPAIDQISVFDVGSCNYVEWLEKYRLCEDKLVASMCHNPDTTLQQCAAGEIGGDFTTCARQSFRPCFAGPGVSDEQVEQQVDARMSDPMVSNTTWFCQLYGLDFALPWQVYGPMCMYNFTERNNACLQPVLDMWSENPADPRICRDFRIMKDCWHRNINQNCLLDVSLKAITDWFDSQFDDYNPFKQCSCVLDTSPAVMVQSTTYTVLLAAFLLLIMTV